MNRVKKIKEFLKGKKTYLFAVIALLTALTTWAEGGIGDVEFATAVFVALQTVFLRAGISNGEKKPK